MEFESDPATEFLKREREELGDLESEIIPPSGKKINYAPNTISFVIKHLVLQQRQ
jgi:hypothetical protein